MATIQKQGDGKYSVRIGNQKFNSLSKQEAQRRADINYQVAPDSQTDSRAQKARNLNLGIKAGDSNTMRDSALRGGVINGSALQNNALIQLPQPAPVKSEMGTILGANASLVNPAMGVTAGANGELVYNAPQTNATGTSAQDTFQSYLNSIQSAQDNRPSAEDTYNQLYKESGLKNINREISNNTAMINNILSKAQAESLGLEGQGRGITESIIGGQQAQISREAAIQALPYQALLANAQGNKELAQQHLDTRFKIQMQDAQNKFDYDMKVIESVRGFIDKQEQRAYDAVQNEKAQAFELKKGDIAFERQKYMENLGFSNSKALKYIDIAANKEAAAIKSEAEKATNVDSKAPLLNLLNQYKSELKDSNAFTARFSPTKVGKLSSLKGQITAEYKKAEKLGTLDAGVQKLIDTIIPPAGGFGLVSLSPSAQVSAIDNFITNQGGTTLSAEDEDEIDNIATGSKGFNPVNYYK